MAGAGEDFRLVFRKAPPPLLIVDLETLGILAANEGAVRALGFAESELVATSLAGHVPPADRERLSTLLGKGQALHTIVEARSAWNLVRRDGATIRFEVGPGPIPFSGHSATILHRTRQAEPTGRDVSASARSLPEFSFTALHDLKEPVHLVKGYLALLRQRSGASLEPESREFLDYAYEGAQRMQAIVLNLLEYLRAETKGIAPEPVDLGASWNEAAASLRLQMREASAHVTQDALPTLLVDRSLVGRVFQNLLSNALKFRAAAPARIHLGLEERGDEWEFNVKDNGIGIDPKDHGRIVQPFQRVYSSDRYPGTGLGLSISKKIVELHGGRLWIVSALGRGTEVHFTLPKERRNGHG